MGRTLNEVMESLPAERQERISARAAELVHEVETLGELRAVAKVSQARMAAAQGVSQPAISKFEREGAAALVGRLADYAHLLGGEVEVIFRLPDHRPIKVRSLDVLAEAMAEPVLVTDEDDQPDDVGRPAIACG